MVRSAKLSLLTFVDRSGPRPTIQYFLHERTELAGIVSSDRKELQDLITSWRSAKDISLVQFAAVLGFTIKSVKLS